jgi:hypothetical protein
MDYRTKKICNIILYFTSAILIGMILFIRFNEELAPQLIIVLSPILFLFGIFILFLTYLEFKSGEEIIVFAAIYRFLFFGDVYKKNKKTPGFRQELIAHILSGIGMIIVAIIIIVVYIVK